MKFPLFLKKPLGEVSKRSARQAPLVDFEKGRELMTQRELTQGIYHRQKPLTKAQWRELGASTGVAGRISAQSMTTCEVHLRHRV
jgi:hypothetical protein